MNEDIIQAIRDHPNSTIYELIPFCERRYRRDPIQASHLRAVINRMVGKGLVEIITDSPRRYRIKEGSQ